MAFPFVQGLLTGEQTGAPTLTNLVLSTGSPKTVTVGNMIVLFLARRGGFSLGSAAGAAIGDNLGNTYTVHYNNTTDPKLHMALATAPVTAGGTLTSITVFPAGIGSVTYHEAGCSAEFGLPPSVSNLGAEYEDFVQRTFLSSTTVTQPEALQVYGIGIGGTADTTETGDSGTYTPPPGFTLASGRLVTGNAPSVYLSYRFGPINEVLTSNWVNAKYSGAVHATGAAFNSFIPLIYRVKRP